MENNIHNTKEEIGKYLFYGLRNTEEIERYLILRRANFINTLSYRKYEKMDIEKLKGIFTQYYRFVIATNAKKNEKDEFEEREYKDIKDYSQIPEKTIEESLKQIIQKLDSQNYLTVSDNFIKNTEYFTNYFKIDRYSKLDNPNIENSKEAKQSNKKGKNFYLNQEKKEWLEEIYQIFEFLQKVEIENKEKYKFIWDSVKTIVECQRQNKDSKNLSSKTEEAYSILQKEFEDKQQTENEEFLKHNQKEKEREI